MKPNLPGITLSLLTYTLALTVGLLTACGGSSGGGGGAAASDTTAPTVTAVTPLTGASGVGVRPSITAIFSEALNASSVSATSFTLLNGASGVAGTVTYSGTTATFSPSVKLANFTTYTATLTTAVKDVAGNALASNYTWTFTTSPINDTGITAAQCYQAGSDVLVSCTSVNARELNPAQDGMLGRDADVASNSSTDGNLGFSFTKIDASGAALPASATTWSCVKDNVTGLIWEVKTVDGGLRDASKTYTNYDSTTALQINGTVAPLQSEIDAATNTVGFKNAVNSATLCGASDWRLPTPGELQSIVDYSVATPGPTIDANWFPNTQGSVFWSSSPYVGNPAAAWSVRFSYGNVVSNFRTDTYYVRLVRAGQ
jgi:hypothetical protein